MGFLRQFKPAQHMQLRFFSCRRLSLIAGRRRGRSHKAISPKALEFDRISTGLSGNLDQTFRKFDITVVVDAYFGDDKAWMPRPYGCAVDVYWIYHAVQPPSTTRLCPVT